MKKIHLFGCNSYLCRNFSYFIKTQISNIKLIGLDKKELINPWIDEYINYDLINYSDELKQFDNEIIINFASNTSVELANAFADDSEYIMNNVKIAETIVKIKPKYGIHISTTSIIKLSNSYSKSKFKQEEILKNNLNWHIIRLNNLYGAYNTHCHPVINPRVLWNVLNENITINVVEDYKIIKRNFLPIQYACEKLYELIINLKQFDIINIGGYKCTIYEFIKEYSEKYKIKFNINIIKNRINEDYDYIHKDDNIISKKMFISYL